LAEGRIFQFSKYFFLTLLLPAKGANLSGKVKLSPARALNSRVSAAIVTGTGSSALVAKGALKGFVHCLTKGTPPGPYRESAIRLAGKMQAARGRRTQVRIRSKAPVPGRTPRASPIHGPRVKHSISKLLSDYFL
jgi:hypothetical protein